jgi:hypothetical protein
VGLCPTLQTLIGGKEMSEIDAFIKYFNENNISEYEKFDLLYAIELLSEK